MLHLGKFEASNLVLSEIVPTFLSTSFLITTFRLEINDHDLCIKTNYRVVIITYKKKQEKTTISIFSEIIRRLTLLQAH